MSTLPTAPDVAADVADLLHRTAQAHHHAFLVTDGFDPEWPLWYAAHLHAPLAALLGHEFTQSDLVFHLVRVDRRYRGMGSDRGWPEVYAEYFLHADL